LADEGVSGEKARAALAHVPALTLQRSGSADARLGSLTLPSSSATEAELKNIERALMHPPKSIDVTRTVLSLLTATALAAKSYGDLKACIADQKNHPDVGLPAFLLVVAAVMVVFVLQELGKRLTEKHPFHAAALAEVQKLIKAQEGKAGDA
jgi:hypothetical protein